MSWGWNEKAGKAASLSFYVSLFLWLMVVYFQTHSSISIKLLLALGIIGMVVSFTASWLFYTYRGTGYEE
jgi:hypothetical protein